MQTAVPRKTAFKHLEYARMFSYLFCWLPSKGIHMLLVGGRTNFIANQRDKEENKNIKTFQRKKLKQKHMLTLPPSVGFYFL